MIFREEEIVMILNAVTIGDISADRKLMEQRRSTPYAHNEHMVGQAEAISLLTTKLTNGSAWHFFISVRGMVGLGKTTLARKLFDGLGKQHFATRAWICVYL